MAETFKYMVRNSHIWLIAIIHYFALGAITHGKEGEMPCQNLAQIRNVIALIGTDLEKEYQKVLY